MLGLPGCLRSILYSHCFNSEENLIICEQYKIVYKATVFCVI